MARIGVRLETGPQLTPHQLVELARLAEDGGFETVWLPEGAGSEALTQLTAIACGTRRITLGTGILPIFHRTPTLLAMGAAGLDAISQGRFILGLGVGHKGAVEGGHGVPFDRPVTRMRETVEIVRGLLKGERVTYEGSIYKLRDSKLALKLARPGLPIYLAALGPRMVELAGEIADGVLLNWPTPSYLQQALEHLRRGAERAGRDVTQIDVACYIRTAVVDDAERAAPAVRRQIARYFTMSYYVNYFQQRGFEAESSAICDALARGDEAAAASAVTGGMCDELTVVGSAQECRRRLDALRGLGLKMPVVAPFPVGGEAMGSFRAVIEAFSA